MAILTFFFWGYLKEKIWKASPASINEIKENLREFCVPIDSEMLSYLTAKFISRIQIAVIYASNVSILSGESCEITIARSHLMNFFSSTSLLTSLFSKFVETWNKRCWPLLQLTFATWTIFSFRGNWVQIIYFQSFSYHEDLPDISSLSICFAWGTRTWERRAWYTTAPNMLCLSLSTPNNASDVL